MTTMQAIGVTNSTIDIIAKAHFGTLIKESPLLRDLIYAHVAQIYNIEEFIRLLNLEHHRKELGTVYHVVEKAGKNVQELMARLRRDPPKTGANNELLFKQLQELYKKLAIFSKELSKLENQQKVNFKQLEVATDNTKQVFETIFAGKPEAPTVEAVTADLEQLIADSTAEANINTTEHNAYNSIEADDSFKAAETTEEHAIAPITVEKDDNAVQGASSHHSTNNDIHTASLIDTLSRIPRERVKKPFIQEWEKELRRHNVSKEAITLALIILEQCALRPNNYHALSLTTPYLPKAIGAMAEVFMYKNAVIQTQHKISEVLSSQNSVFQQIANFERQLGRQEPSNSMPTPYNFNNVPSRVVNVEDEDNNTYNFK